MKLIIMHSTAIYASSLKMNNFVNMFNDGEHKEIYDFYYSVLIQ